jgi:hypothetical protein
MFSDFYASYSVQYRRELGYAFEGQNQFQKDVVFNHADHAGKRKRTRGQWEWDETKW